MTEIHRIEDLKFSELWCLCTCGELIQSTDQMNMPEDWKAHRARANQPNRSLFDHRGDGSGRRAFTITRKKK